MKLPSWLRAEPKVARVEPLESRHAARLAAIHGTAFARPWSRVDFETMLAGRDAVAQGLFVGTRPDPLGFVLSRRVLDEAELLTIALAPEARGQGRARLLLAHHLQRLAHEGARQVHLEVDDGNAPALALYRKLGFRETGRREGYYAKPDGSRATALTMSRALA